MGTDIHAVIQIKGSEGWVDVDYVEPWPLHPERLDLRNYAFFTALAGVRQRAPIEDGPLPVIAWKRGLPADFPYKKSLLVYGYEDGILHPREGGGEFSLGYHDHSWVTLAEMVDWLAEYETSLAPEDSEQMRRWVHYLRGIGRPGEIRVVFGFDS